MVYSMPKHLWILGFISILAFGAISGVFYATAASPQSGLLMPQTPLGKDPLTASEQQTISQLLNTLIPPGVDGPTQREEDEVETLLIERHREAKGVSVTTRRGDAYLYDYSTDTLIHAVVNPTTGGTDEVRHLQGVQLPLIEDEVTRAIEIVEGTDTSYREIAQRYREITGMALTGLDQLQIKAFTFRADSMPDRVNSGSQACGLSRCAQLLLYTQDQVAFEMMPIVNLSTKQVVQTMAFGIEAANRGETENEVGPSGATGQTDRLYLPFVSGGAFDAK